MTRVTLDVESPFSRPAFSEDCNAMGRSMEASIFRTVRGPLASSRSWPNARSPSAPVLTDHVL
jgi:hypothetical protein